MKVNNPFIQAQDMLGNDSKFSNVELQKLGGVTELVKQLQDFNNIYGITEYNSREIILNSKISTMSKIMDFPEYMDVLKFIAILKLSSNRKSRDEVGSILNGMRKKNISDQIREKLGQGDGNGE